MPADWAHKRLLPAFEAPHHLDVYDIRDAAYDVQLSVTTMTGLVNRQQPRIYLLSNDDAHKLLNTILNHIPSTLVPIKAESVLDDLLQKHRHHISGMIIYDPALLDSANVATTLAGVRDAIVVSPRQAEALQSPPHQLPVLADLRIYGWQNRLQVYRWAIRNLLPETSDRLVAGMHPQIAGGLRSFLVATRAFVYWLDPRFQFPNPLNGLRTERCLMKQILRRYAPGTPHFGWFMYEGQGVKLASKAAMPVLPSDYFFNLEVWTAVQPSQQKEQAGQRGNIAAETNTTTTGRQVSPKVYVSFTISDGDNLQFNQHRMYRFWQDPARGSIPIGWTISPALIQAAPTLAAYYLQTATPDDELIAGPSGAGYILPPKWPQKHLLSFLQLTGSLMQQMRLSIIEVLDATPPLLRPFIHHSWPKKYARALSPFGIQGILKGDSYHHTAWSRIQDIPVLQNLGLSNSKEMTLQLIRKNTPPNLQQPQFINVYIHAWSMTPSDIKEVIQTLGSQYAVVTPGKLLAMIAES